LKRANTKTKMAFWASLKELSSVSEEGIGAKGRFDPKNVQRKDLHPGT